MPHLEKRWTEDTKEIVTGAARDYLADLAELEGDVCAAMESEYPLNINLDVGS